MIPGFLFDNLALGLGIGIAIGLELAHMQKKRLGEPQEINKPGLFIAYVYQVQKF